MYTGMEFSVEGLTIKASASSAGDFGQQGSNVLYPLSMRGSASLCRLPLQQLAWARVTLSVEVVELAVTPQHIELLRAVSEMQQQAPVLGQSANALQTSRGKVSMPAAACFSAHEGRPDLPRSLWSK